MRDDTNAERGLPILEGIPIASPCTVKSADTHYCELVVPPALEVEVIGGVMSVSVQAMREPNDAHVAAAELEPVRAKKRSK